jgi:hypothetical protein
MPPLVPLRLAVAFTCVATVLGCGRQASVQGRVTLAGKPVETGTIAFIPIEGTKAPVAGAGIAMGEYRLAIDAVPGTYRVEVSVPKKTGKKFHNDGILIRPDEPLVVSDTDEIVEGAPPEFNKKSNVRAVLAPGSNTLDYDMK